MSKKKRISEKLVDKTTFYKNTVKSRVYDTVASNSLENKKKPVFGFEMRRGNNKKVGTYYLMAVQQESLSRARGTRKFFQSARPFHVLHNIVENRRDLLFSVDSRYKLSTLWVEKRTKNKCRNFDHDAIMARLSATELSVHTFPKKNLHENYKL